MEMITKNRLCMVGTVASVTVHTGLCIYCTDRKKVIQE